MTLLVGTAAASLLRRLLPWLIGFAVLAGAALYVQSLRSGWTEAAAEASAAKVRVARLKAAARLNRSHARLAMGLVLRGAERERLMAGAVAEGLEEIRNAKAPVPESCRPALRPLGVALDRMRRMESTPAGAGSPRSAGPVLPGSADDPDE